MTVRPQSGTVKPTTRGRPRPRPAGKRRTPASWPAMARSRSSRSSRSCVQRRGHRTCAEWHTVTQVGFDHDKLAVYVWRSVRADGDTKTQKSRRTLEVPAEVARALRQHHTKQAARRLRARETWQDHDLVLCTRNGKPLAAVPHVALTARHTFENQWAVQHLNLWPLPCQGSSGWFRVSVIVELSRTGSP